VWQKGQTFLSRIKKQGVENDDGSKTTIPSLEGSKEETGLR
jgi:hypothetical protein